MTDGLAIYDTMQYVQPDVSTICVGLAASMGQFLLCAGAPGKRFALPHSRILMHQPSGAMQGQAADIAIQAEQIIYLKRMMAERIAFHTGQPIERIETRLRPRPLVHGRRGQGVRLHRQRDRPLGGHHRGGDQIGVALDVPASSSDADRRLEEAPEERVADRSPMAAEAAGLSERAARRGRRRASSRRRSASAQRLREIWAVPRAPGLPGPHRDQGQVQELGPRHRLVDVGAGDDAGHLLLRLLDHPEQQASRTS